jgi:putative endonuclease
MVYVTVHALYSSSFNKLYIGFTSDLPNRFLSHNELATKGHTIKFLPRVITFNYQIFSK